MNTKLILTSTSIFLGICGLSLSFLPQELLEIFLSVSNDALSLPLQIMGSLYLALAFINWMSRSNLIGGIYNRPLAMGNALHFSVVAVNLVKYVVKYSAHSFELLILTLIYIMFAIVFFKVIFTTPKKVTKT